MIQALRFKYVKFCKLAALFAANTRRALPPWMSELYRHSGLKNEGKLLRTVALDVFTRQMVHAVLRRSGYSSLVDYRRTASITYLSSLLQSYVQFDSK
jgi:hypothetical protein